MSDLRALPFVEVVESGKPLSYWNVTSTGDWSHDCDMGRTYADLLVHYMASSGDITALARVSREAAHDEKARGVAAGFMTRVAELAVQAAR